MKVIKIFIVAALILNNPASFAAQKDPDAEAIKFLTEFYTVYNTTWSAPLAPKVLADSLLSLQIKYCTIDFSIELMTDVDHDILINDHYTDVHHLSSLTIKKHPSLKHTYIVSYTAPIRSPTNRPIEKKVIIFVTTTITEARGIKIAAVCSP